MLDINGINKQVIKEYIERHHGYLLKNTLVSFSIVAFAITLIVSLLLFSNSSSYVAIDVLEDDYANFESPQTLASWLKDRNYKYKFSDDQKLVYVDYEDYPKILRSISSSNQGSASSKNMAGFELLDNSRSFGTSQFMESIRYRRALEGELARTISSMSNIKSARVHLAIPKKSAFLRDVSPSSASVFIKTDSSDFDSHLIDSIINLVAKSISGMKPENVTVVDQFGALLSDNSDGYSQLVLPIKQEKAKLKYQKLIEKQYKNEIKKILSPLLGNENYKVALDVNLKFVNSKSKLAKSSDVINTQYGSLRITNITSMVLLPNMASQYGQESNISKPLLKHDITKIKKLISTVIPFDKKRGDIVLVDNMVESKSISYKPNQLSLASFNSLKKFFKNYYLYISIIFLGLILTLLLFKKSKDKSKSDNLKAHKNIKKKSKLEANQIKYLDLNSVADEKLFNRIKNMHIQVQAVILNLLSPHRAGNILTKYNHEVKLDIIIKLLFLSKLNKNTLDKIYSVLKNKLRINIQRNEIVKGYQNVLQILFFLKLKDEKIISKLSNYNEKIGTEVNNRIFQFENLAFLNDNDLKLILEKISDEKLFYSLKSSDPIMSNKFINNLTPDRAKKLKSMLDSYHPVKISDAEKAQNEILEAYGESLKSGTTFCHRRKPY